jgi:hypothetical protein
MALMQKKHLQDDELLALNARGFIPGPDEDEYQFLSRVHSCLKDDQASTMEPSLIEALNHVQHLFDVKPDWLHVLYKNQGLAPWEGAATWIFPSENGELRAEIQMKKTFKSRNSYLGIYRKEELLAHEMTHAVRMAFDSSRYEELIAYKTSGYKLRRWLGPMLENRTEAYLLISALLICLVAPYLAMIFPSILLDTSWEVGFFLFFFLPVLLLLAANWRTAKRQKVWKRCVENVAKAVGCINKARYIAFRLTDEELSCFSKAKTEEILAYAERKKSKLFRWKVIWKAYFC